MDKIQRKPISPVKSSSTIGDNLDVKDISFSLNRMNKELTHNFGKNSVYLGMKFTNPDENKKGLSDNELFEIIFEGVGLFKNLNFLKHPTESEYQAVHNGNIDNFKNVGSAYYYLLERLSEKDISDKIFKRFEEEKIDKLRGGIDFLANVNSIEKMKDVINETIYTDSFKKDLLSKNKYDLVNVYRLFSIAGVKEYSIPGFYFTSNFSTNNGYNVVTDVLASDFKNAKCFDKCIIGYTNVNPDIIREKLESGFGRYRNNTIFVDKDVPEYEIPPIDPVMKLFYDFKGISFRKQEYIGISKHDFNTINESFKYIKQVNLFWSSHIFDIPEFYNDDFDNYNKVLSAFRSSDKNERDTISVSDFLSFCNCKRKNKIYTVKHNISFLDGTFSELVKNIRGFKKVVIADFETTGLNKSHEDDIVSFSYKMFSGNGEFIRERDYFIENPKKDFSEGASDVFNIEEYNKKEKIGRRTFISGFESLIDDETLFIFHNGLKFDVNIIADNFTDLGKSIKGMNVLDSIYLSREYQKSLQNKDYNTFSYSLDNISKNLYIKNDRKGDAHTSMEDVTILSDLVGRLVWNKKDPLKF